MNLHQDIQAYHEKLDSTEKDICQLLASTIVECIPEVENKVWHAHPVWFLEGNPIVGYSKLKGGIRLLFWSGQTFEEDALHPEGKFKAAEIRYTAVEQINIEDLTRWLDKAINIQWDYKNIVKRKGQLLRLK